MTKIFSAFLIALTLLLSGCDSSVFSPSKTEKLADQGLHFVLNDQLDSKKLFTKPEYDRYTLFEDSEKLYHAAYTVEFINKENQKTFYLIVYFQFKVVNDVLNIHSPSIVLEISDRAFADSDEEYIAYTEKVLKEKIKPKSKVRLL